MGLLNRAYQLGEASQVAVFEHSVMIFGPVFGWVLLGQTVTALQGAGIVLIAAAGIIIALRSRASARVLRSDLLSAPNPNTSRAPGA